MTTHPVSEASGFACDSLNDHPPAAAALEKILGPRRGGAGSTGFAACALTGDPQDALDARHFTASMLRGWDMAALVDDVGVIVSELVSNASRYGLRRGAEADGTEHPVWLGLLRQGSAVLCSVSDPGTDVPVVKEPDWDAETGRGLHVIDALSDSWGWTAPDRTGKAVWAVVSPPSVR